MPLQLNKTKVLIECDGFFIFCINDDSCYGQDGAGMRDFFACIGKQQGTQSGALKLFVYSQPTDKCDRYWIAGKFPR